MPGSADTVRKTTISVEDDVSLIHSLLEGLDDSDRDRTIGLINSSIAADLESVAAGSGPSRQVDVGTRGRASRGAGQRSGARSRH